MTWVVVQASSSLCSKPPRWRRVSPSNTARSGVRSVLADTTVPSLDTSVRAWPASPLRLANKPLTRLPARELPHALAAHPDFPATEAANKLDLGGFRLHDPYSLHGWCQLVTPHPRYWYLEVPASADDTFAATLRYYVCDRSAHVQPGDTPVRAHVLPCDGLGVFGVRASGRSRVRAA